LNSGQGIYKVLEAVVSDYKAGKKIIKKYLDIMILF